MAVRTVSKPLHRFTVADGSFSPILLFMLMIFDGLH